MEYVYKSLEHVPGILGMVVVAVIFSRLLKFTIESHNGRMKEMTSSQSEERKEFLITVREINASAKEVATKSTTMLERNVEALALNTASNKEVSQSFRNFACKYGPH